MASPLQFETPAEKERRIEQEKLQKQMDTIGFESVDTPVPVETTEPSTPTVLNFLKQQRQSFAAPTSEPVESTPMPSKTTTVPSFNWERMRTPRTEVQKSYDPSKPYSVQDLELGEGPRNFEGESFNEVFERFGPSIGETEDAFETIRDSKYTVTDAMTQGFKSKNWTNQQKKDWAFLKPTFENANLNNLNQILEATKDIGIDIIGDPMNLFFAYLTVQTGGIAALGLSGAARIATSQGLKQGLKTIANNKTFRAASIGYTEGSYDAGMVNLGNQLTEVNTGLRKEIDTKELGLSTAIGGTFGAALGPAAYKTTNYLLRRKTQKVLDALKIEIDSGPVTEEIFNEYNATLQFFDAITSNTFGKGTTEFIETTKVSPVIKQFLLGLNPKALQRISTARSEKVDAPLRATSREGDLGYATDQETLSGQFTTFIDEVLDPQVFGRVRDRDNGWFNLGTALDTNDNLSLAYLLTKGDLLDDYVKVIAKDPNKPFVNLEVKKQIKNVVPDSRITDLQKKYDLEFNEDLYEAAAKIRYFFKQLEIKAKNIDSIQPDGSFKVVGLLDEEQAIPNYFYRILNYDAITATRESLKIFRDMLIRSGHANPNNTVKTGSLPLVSETPKMTGTGGVERNIPDIRNAPRRDSYIEDNTIDKEYFKDLDSPYIEGEKILQRHDSFEDLAEFILKKENKKLDTDSIFLKAQELKADALLEKLRKEQYFNTTKEGSSKGAKTEFLNSRVWNRLSDEELIANNFVNTNMLPLLKDYGYTMGQKITETKYFGFGSNFKERWIPAITKELDDSGKFTKKEIIKITKRLEKIKDLAVGSPNSHIKLPTRAINALDIFRTTQVLAHLPFATVSSISEPFIALAKSDLLSDTPSFVKEYGKAGILQIRKNFGTNGRLWDQISLTSGKKVYGFKDLTDEAFLDVKRWGVAVEQSMMARVEGMFAENIQNKSARNLNNMFFNVTLLQQWTQAVQMGSFNFAKARTIRITKELTEGKNQFGKQLSKNEIKRRKNQLHEIGIDSQDAMFAYRNSIINGEFDLKTFQDKPFYDTQLNPGAQVFAKEVILNPSASNMNKPVWFSNPFAQVAVQFAGYPTAFNNTVLKGFARDLYRYPVQSAPAIIAATTMMTGVAHLGNTIRSRGENLKKDDQTLLLDAVERPGLMGAASHIYRYHRGTAFNQGFVGGITKAFGGPIFSDYADAIQYSSTPYDLAVQNMPFYGGLSPKSRRELRKWAQVKHHQHYGKPKKNLRSIKSKGGVVEDVLNVISEPDERKMRGLPNTYSGMAGVLFQDEEERGAFATGGKVSIKDTDQMYGYLTKDEDEYNVVIDKDPIRVYTKEDFPDLHIKETYYTGFKGNTVSDRLNSVRHSSTIGLPVTTNKKKARGVVQAAGKIKFNNVLKLNIDTATPDAVQAELNKNMESLIKIEDKILGKEIIQAANDNLAIRDAVLNKDSNRTPEKEAVIARNKSFLVRHQLLKLGYDAIETKEGYTLLRENQFLPTDIIDKRQPVFIGGLVEKGRGLLGALLRRSKRAVNRAETKIEDIQYQTKDAVLIGGPYQAVPRSVVTDKKILPKLFRDKLRDSESSGRYDVVNSLGYMGAYQFGNSRLKDYRDRYNKSFTNEEFLTDNKLQDEVFDWHVNDIRKGIKRNKLDQYIGQKINGVPITEPGMVGVAHLGGFTGMQRFITNLGKEDKQDDYGTKMSDYLDKFKHTRFEKESYNEGGLATVLHKRQQND